MSSKRSQPMWVEVRDPPQWVRDAAYEWFADPRSWSQDQVLHLSSATYDYRIRVEVTGGTLRWHYFRRQNLAQPNIAQEPCRLGCRHPQPPGCCGHLGRRSRFIGKDAGRRAGGRTRWRFNLAYSRRSRDWAKNQQLSVHSPWYAGIDPV